MNFKQIAIKAAKEAGKIQLRYYEKDVVKRFKDNDSIVTQADIESTKKIRKIILKEFPEHSILDEELRAIKTKSDYRWIIDPLDGTHNFVMDNPLFGVSIALEYKKEVILGVVYMPVLKRLYYGEKGKGAYCNGKRIRVNNIGDVNKCLFTYDAKVRTGTNRKIDVLKRLAPVTWRLRIYGVAVYHNLLVAEGKSGFNIDFDSNSWDHSATLLIVEEAGGKVTDINGNKWRADMKSYLASNGKVHEKVLSVFKK